MAHFVHVDQPTSHPGVDRAERFAATVRAAWQAVHQMAGVYAGALQKEMAERDTRVQHDVKAAQSRYTLLP